MTEKELDQVSGGAAYIKFGDLRGRRGWDIGPVGEASLSDPTWSVGKEVDPIGFDPGPIGRNGIILT